MRLLDGYNLTVGRDISSVWRSAGDFSDIQHHRLDNRHMQSQIFGQRIQRLRSEGYLQEAGILGPDLCRFYDGTKPDDNGR